MLIETQSYYFRGACWRVVEMTACIVEYGQVAIYIKKNAEN
jgi:hypothetical protein